MKSTLLLRCQAPLQAWGVQSLFNVRDSCCEPTKSGVIGLLAAALGRGRHEPVDDLLSLRMGVRIDQEGVLMKDFQTARDVINAVGKSGANVISDRYFLSDAIFLVGLESDDPRLLETLFEALKHPQWLLFLGRRAFPAAKPVWLLDGLQTGIGLEDALLNFPCLLNEPAYHKADLLRFVFEDPQGNIFHNDLPLSFAERSYHQRAQSIHFYAKPSSYLQEAPDVP